MGKRRRERDRPKAANNAPYHPNKRILLSYDSDEEHHQYDGDSPVGTGHPTTVDAITANYEIAEYPDDEYNIDGESEDAGARGRDEAGITKDDPPPTEGEAVEEADEVVPQGRGKTSKRRRTVGRNATTGQWPALGSLAYERDEDEEAEEEEDDDSAGAMAYLRAVRSERQNLPTIFAAPHDDENGAFYTNEIGDGRGYLSDGAYIGRATIGLAEESTTQASVEPQTVYTQALKKRFLHQREFIHSPLGVSRPIALGKKHPTSFPAGNKAYSEWLKLLNLSAPLPTQVSLLDLDATNRLLLLIQRMYLVRGKDISEIMSAWIWSLLTRLDDVGTMNNGQVYQIRDFGKRAVLVQLSFNNPAAAEQLGAMDAEEGAAMEGALNLPEQPEQPEQRDAVSGGDADVAKNNNIASEQSSERQNTLATLDMIITIVGEIFGQRDLLEFRQQWQAPEEQATAGSE